MGGREGAALRRYGPPERREAGQGRGANPRGSRPVLSLERGQEKRLSLCTFASSHAVTVYFGGASAVAMSLPVMTDEPLADGAFFMDVADDALAAMDEYERKLEERYRAAGERDARALQFNRD